MKNIVVEKLNFPIVSEQDIELVERKGIGHPDSICDGIGEAVSRALCREYLKRFGVILHHNTDQGELVAGESNPVFGGGEIIKPIYFLINGRATTYIENKGETEKIPVGRIAVEAAKNYFKENLRNINPETDVIFDQKVGQGSGDLMHMFKSKTPMSNDTSFGVGFAPLSEIENIVLETEKYINNIGKEKLNIKAAGNDVKVMGVRKKNKISITVACAMVSKYIKDIDEYSEIKKEMHDKIMNFMAKKTDKEITLDINTADDIKSKSVYLTVTGLSAENGDDGSVGRGNRCNGLIAPYRPMSMEATAGKNPINHVGKLYNLLSNKIAEEIADEGAKQVYVRIMSQIGKDISNPMILSIQLDKESKDLEKKAYEIAEYNLDHIEDITKLLVEGKITVF